jgi:hypothetical protein
MAYNTSNRSERLLQGRRFTTDNLSLTQEAFTDVFDLGAGEIFTDDGLIPSGSTQLAYSGSSQNGAIVSGSVVNPSIETDVNVLKYHYRKKLKQAADGQREVYYFTTSDPSEVSDTVTSDQLIEADQQTNFVSPKYIIASDSPNNTESSTPGYKVVVYKDTASSAGDISSSPADPSTYVFDFKTGVLTWVSSAPSATQFVYISVYQYIGRTLRSQIDDGSIGGGGGASSFSELSGVPAGLISGSSQLPSGLISGSSQLPSGLISGSTQIATEVSGAFTSASSSLAADLLRTSTWSVGAAGGAYTFAGPGLSGTENKPALYLMRGEKYRFSVDASGHPFYIQTSAGAYNASNVYTDGVTGGGAVDGNVDFNVQFDAPNLLYYVCSNHSGMGNAIHILNKDSDGLISGSAQIVSGLVGQNISVGELTATKVVTNIVSQSIAFATGSTIFGDEITDAHQMTGSLSISGSLSFSEIDGGNF